MNPPPAPPPPPCPPYIGLVCSVVDGVPLCTPVLVYDCP